MCSTHPIEASSAAVLRGVIDAGITSCRCYIFARRQLQLNLTQQLQDVFV